MSGKTTAALSQLRERYDEQRRYLRERERAAAALDRLPQQLRDDSPTVWMDGFGAGYNEALAMLRDALA